MKLDNLVLKMAVLKMMLLVSAFLVIRAEEESKVHIHKPMETDSDPETEASKSLLRRKRDYYGHCTPVNTPFTVDGGGNTVYLDRQSPNCGLTAMRSFHLVRNGAGNHVRYDLSCCSLPRDFSCTTESRHTMFNFDGKGKVVYLDRHQVTCPYNGFLKQFHLNRNGGHDMYRYTYSCCTPNGSERANMRCTSHSTPTNSDGGGKNFVYLDRHQVTCHLGYFLNSFRLARPSPGNIRYDYRCCAYIRNQ